MPQTPHIPVALGAEINHIGAELAARRAALGYTQQDVADHLNIRKAYIIALETHDAEALPAIGYVLGYVRAYAGFVGLPGVEAVARYKSDQAVPENLGLRSLPHFIPKRRIRLPRGLVPALSVLGGAAAFVGWYASSAPVSAAPSPAALTLDAPARNLLPRDPSALTLKAIAPSWVEISDASGRVVMSRIMITDEVWAAPKDASLFISARDGGALTLYAGRELLGTFGERGVPFSALPLSQSSIVAQADAASAPLTELSVEIKDD
jgi:transcriptional regulator with XRE-family HTH domain